MGTRQAAEQRPPQVAPIPLRLLRVHPKNIRVDLGDLTDLADSLKHEGQHQLIEVHRKGSFFEILDGHRRFGAAVIARLRTLQAVIVPERSDREAIAGMLTTGLHARGLSPEERKNALDALVLQHNMSTAELAARCGVTADTIRRWRSTTSSPAHRPTPSASSHATSPRAPQPKPVPKWAQSVRSLADEWEQKCSPDGLHLDDVTELFRELRALTGVQGGDGRG